jgi:chromosome segregation protein
MYFKRLELHGFKSFADKTVLDFEPGITAVVGPNGCGKSNIFDSIRWVLGEQSAKSLRGSEMQDIIFNGTDNRESVGMSEVTLTFDNKNRFFNFDNDEMDITRRLFRSGESEYLLNKSTVRLKDILDILLGTGVGAESYSIVAQGKIDLVLSSKPEDRRIVFDEASGITKYKAQKRETMRKLEDTDQNLLRVNDIVIEVKRQIGSLERQANKARKYKEVFEELKTKEIKLAIVDKIELVRQKDEIIAQLKDFETKESELLACVREQEARINNRQMELKALEDNMMAAKTELMNLENQIIRNNERISFNNEKSHELAAQGGYLGVQIVQAREKLIVDEDKYNQLKSEFDALSKTIEEKNSSLGEKQIQINILEASIKQSLDTISESKKKIMDLVSRIAHAKNELSDFNSKMHTFQSRKKRLDIEKAKVYEDRVITEDNLNNIIREAEAVKKVVDDINSKICGLKGDLERESMSLSQMIESITNAEKEKFTLESHKEFLDKLRTKYEDIGESMNAVIYLDKMPKEFVSGLVIKVRDSQNLSDEDKSYFDPAAFKVTGEAKPIELDTKNIEEKIAHLEEVLVALRNDKMAKESGIGELNNFVALSQKDLREQEISLANKETSRDTVLEQFNRIKEEEDLIVLELNDVHREVSAIEGNISTMQTELGQLNNEHRLTEDLIAQEEEHISINSKSREQVLVVITQFKTELESLNKRIVSDESTLKLLEDTFTQDKETLANISKQIEESSSRKESMERETEECKVRIAALEQDKHGKVAVLQEAEKKYEEVSAGASDVISRIEADRGALDDIKNSLHELQMHDKDVEYKYATMKERMLQAYKLDLDTAEDPAEEIDTNAVSQEIAELKRRLDSYGSVNMVAIEEYDELKQRYDFLIQQQTDLVNAKEALHQAILKINRTTKQMFLETFEKVRVEYKNYFRLLFNGGDAQLFLTDENDPLESGIEIICRPPGKKLQNVLLLSGGEKAMAAIALIFAIFKVKPSPFCILDEIDAALDEANVDRFGRMLAEFAKGSQFIVITHNKKTIANADVMYGITMEQSGVSKIVSVKFGERKEEEVKELEAVAEPV